MNIENQVKDEPTLRDYFAAKVLQGVLADLEGSPWPEKLTSAAYTFADAMLAEMAKKHD